MNRSGVRVSLDDLANDDVNCPQQSDGDNVSASFENIMGSYGD